jgi:hypothetical protein
MDVLVMVNPRLGDGARDPLAGRFSIMKVRGGHGHHRHGKVFAIDGRPDVPVANLFSANDTNPRR